MRETFAQVAGNDALNALVDLDDALAGTSVQYHAGRKAKEHGRNDTKRECSANDVSDLGDFVVIPSDRQDIAIRQLSRDQSDRLP
jgi:hypothetical protein